MTKAEMIEKYGIEYYEDFKAKSRARMKKLYHSDIELARKKVREEYRRNSETAKAYIKAHREIYRIGCRDRNRLVNRGYSLDGMEIHHLKYHRNNDDEDWLDDIIVMPREEHRKWHFDHPEFRAKDNIV
jgi:hypothetical protein